MNCTCVKVPLPNKVKGSKITAYTTTGNCPVCTAQRALDQVAALERAEIERKNMMIATKQRDLAIKELKKEGKLPVDFVDF